MKEKYNEATRQRPEGTRKLDGPIVTMDLPSYLEQIKQEESWGDSDRNAITLYHADGMRIVLIAMHAGAEMKPYTAEGIISMQVIEGQIRFATEQKSVDLVSGQMLALHERIPHSILATSEATILLTLAVNDKAENGFL